jgi:hypothetical protein
MSESQHSTSRYVFPRWANYMLPGIIVMVVGGALYVPLLFGFGASAKTMAVGYAPIQPVPYSHALHAGKLGIDCRYCHTTVETAAFAAIPPTQTCMNCHSNIKTESEKLKPIRESWTTGKPVQWTKVHDLPDFAYFNHSAHVSHGVGCVTCHGRIDQIEVVQQAQPLSMSWCLECHREPERFIRPKDQVTNMDYTPKEDQLVIGKRLKEEYKIHDATYMQSCYTCHR